MLRALLRFILIDHPRNFLSGLSFIIFDHEEIYSCTYQCRRFRNKDFNKKVLRDYLDSCFRIVQEENADEKRLDKD